jgi:hypothetical protein
VLALLAPAAALAETARLGIYMDIARDLNRLDARATLEIWAGELTRKFQVPTSVAFYGDMESLRGDFDDGRINLVIADAMTFVRHFKAAELSEGFGTKLHSDASLLLLARNPSDNTGLSGKRVARIANDDISAAYLETLCLRQSGRSCQNLPVNVFDVANNHQALTRLLFNQADYALVNRHGYLLAVELNPQLGQIGRSVEELKFDTQYYGFFSARVDKTFRRHALSRLQAAEHDPRGRQLLDIFKVESLTLADASALVPFYKLERDFRDLKAKAGRRRK